MRAFYNCSRLPSCATAASRIEFFVATSFHSKTLYVRVSFIIYHCPRKLPNRWENVIESQTSMHIKRINVLTPCVRAVWQQCLQEQHTRGSARANISWQRTEIVATTTSKSRHVQVIQNMLPRTTPRMDIDDMGKLKGAGVYSDVYGVHMAIHWPGVHPGLSYIRFRKKKLLSS